MPSQSNTRKPNSTSETKSQYPLSLPTCNYCKKPGHLVSECLKLKRKLERDEAKPTGLTTHRPRPQSSIKTNRIDIVTKPKSDSTMEIFETFMMDGFVSLSRVYSRARPCAISTYFLQMAHRKSHEGADPAHKFSGKNLLGSEFILHKNVGIHLPSTA